MLLTLLASLLLLTASQDSLDAQPPADDPERPRRLTAAPAENIAVDGFLNETAWATADVGTDFVQFRPDEGDPASQRTEVRVLRGATALYVGARLLDADPNGIRTALSRRDEIGDADAFLTAIDSYNDDRTAYEFAVSAAGAQFDAIMTNGNEDSSWDAVWDSAVRLTDDGWVAELRIPYSQLRFTGEEPEWGINFVRVVPRLDEQSFWAPVTRQQAGAGFVQFFGVLDGVAEVNPVRALQAQPYVSSRARRFESETPGTATADYGADMGADFKVGLSSNIILDATVNPDFGQVEADPAVLNLSTFETFFNERRPFFLEGTQIFDLDFASGDGALLYTRRIGGASPIVGASKITGRLANGLSFGVLGAATGTDGNPERGYAAARVKQDLGGQNSVGGGLTAYTSGAGDLTARSVVGAADWDIRLGSDEAWMFEGTVAGSSRTLGEHTDLGTATYVGLDKVKGYFAPGFGVRVYTDGFRMNDVGRFRQTNLYQFRAGAGHTWNRNEPVGPFRQLDSGLFATQTFQYTDGLNRGLEMSLFSGGQLRGFQSVNLSLGADGLGGYDVRETRGLGPVAHRPGVSGWFSFGTDSRKEFRAWLGAGTNQFVDGGASYSQFAEVDWIATDRLSLSLSGETSFGFNRRAWVANESLVLTDDALLIGEERAAPDELTADDLVPVTGLSAADAAALVSGLPAYGTSPLPDADAYYVPIFGHRDTRSANLTARTNVLFNPNLSLQLYGQLFAARGHYDDYTLLASRDEFRDADAYPRRSDFAFSSLNLNAVLRWQYRPGSSLYVVWTQARGLDDFQNTFVNGGPVRSPYQTSTGQQFRDTFAAFPENVLLVKLSYLLFR